jgi:hypothetical protein
VIRNVTHTCARRCKRDTSSIAQWL